MKRLFAIALVLLGSCSNDVGSRAGSSGTPRNWTCSESDQCSCEALKPGVTSISSGPIDQCLGYTCCVLTEQATETTVANCECFDSASCAAEASSRRGATVVSQCPPASETISPACAAAGENCRQSYLDQNGLSGCCQGTLCRTGAAGVPLCQAGSAEELALDAQCRKDARKTRALEVAPPASVKTSVGALKLDQVSSTFDDLGPSGCLSSIDMTFAGQGSLCRLELKAALQNGHLVPSYVFGNLGDCEGFNSMNSGTVILEDKPAGVPFEFAFQGLSCAPNCVAGTFDWHLTGTVDGVTFDDQHLVAKGTVCWGIVDQNASCPSP